MPKLKTKKDVRGVTLETRQMDVELRNDTKAN